MQKIPLLRATSGMTLARDVFRSNSPAGIPVCGKGTVLTDSLITRFGNMDVQSIYVEGHPVKDEGDRTIDQVLDDLDNRFSKTRQEPLNIVLHGIYRAFLIRSMGGESD